MATGALVATTVPLLVTSAADAAHPRAIPAFSIRLEDQILAELRYLPVSFVPAASTPPPTTTSTTSTTSTTTTTTTLPTTGTGATTSGPTTTTTVPTRRRPTRASDPAMMQSGSFVWRFPTLPASFKENWSVGTDNVILRGALMRFQEDHGLPTTGSMDGVTWQLLVETVRARKFSSTPYNMVLVSQTLPQRLDLYQNGRVTFTTLVNTGIPASPTANGTFPVYLRFTTTTMSGTNPNGTHYHDTGIPWVSYFNGGDALHGFIRAGYGYPQSLGCVEMPFAEAKALWVHTPIGTLVTVQP